MQALRNSMSCFIPEGVASNILIAILCSFINMKLKLPNEDCIIGLQDDLRVEFLFCDEIINRTRLIVQTLTSRPGDEAIQIQQVNKSMRGYPLITCHNASKLKRSS